LWRGAIVPDYARSAFRFAAALYLLILVVDLVNGSPFESLVLSTGVNYLPLLLFMPVFIALREFGVTREQVILGTRLGVWAACADDGAEFATAY
jgi:hypothetical protein